ncbi:hypothetical protein D3C75_714810 [compost metagenome]
MQVGRHHLQAANELDGIFIRRTTWLLYAVEYDRLLFVGTDAAHGQLGISAAARVLYLAPCWIECRVRAHREQRQTVRGAVQWPL